MHVQPFAGLESDRSSAERKGDLFARAFGLLWLLLLFAVFLFFRALSIRGVDVPINEGVVEYHESNNYLDVLYGSAIMHLQLEAENEKLTDRKVTLVAWGHALTIAAIAVFALFEGSIVARQWTHPVGTQPQKETENVTTRRETPVR